MTAALRQQSATAEATHLMERELVEIWAGQRFPGEALRLADGSLLRVIYRGRPGRGPGPDFRDAVIAMTDGTVLRGDIELHVKASDFRRHGHHLDPAYNSVVLHVVFHHDGGATLLRSGGEVLTIALAPWVASRAGELQDWLSRPPLWQEPCRDAVSRLGAGEVRQRLVRLGRRRLRQKADALRRRIEAEGADDAVYRELLEAAGYGPNRQAFRLLAATTTWRAIGVDPSQLGAIAVSQGIRFERQTRPGATPEDRLRGAELLLQRLSAGRRLASNLVSLVHDADSGTGLVAALCVRDGGRTVIGAGRAAELAVNVALPAAICAEVPEADLRLYDLYETIPDPGSYGLTAYLEGLLRRQDSSLLKGAAERQGVLLLQKDYCSQGGCGSCPLSGGDRSTGA